jgi:outer membrane cobalamin receptor
MLSRARRSFRLFAALSTTAAAQDAVVLEPLVIEAQRWETDWLAAPAAIGALDLTQTQQGAQNLAVDEVLNRLPGVFVQIRAGAGTALLRRHPPAVLIPRYLALAAPAAHPTY